MLQVIVHALQVLHPTPPALSKVLNGHQIKMPFDLPVCEALPEAVGVDLPLYELLPQHALQGGGGHRWHGGTGDRGHTKTWNHRGTHYSSDTDTYLRDDPEPLLADQLGRTERPGVEEGEDVLSHMVQTLGIPEYLALMKSVFPPS